MIWDKKFHYLRVSTGDRPLIKKPEDSGYEIGVKKSNLVLRVLRLVGQRAVAGRDSGCHAGIKMEKFDFFDWLFTDFTLTKLRTVNRRIQAVIISLPRASHGDYPLNKKPEDSR